MFLFTSDPLLLTQQPAASRGRGTALGTGSCVNNNTQLLGSRGGGRDRGQRGREAGGLRQISSKKLSLIKIAEEIQCF